MSHLVDLSYAFEALHDLNDHGFTALNVDNFSANRYLYVFLTGVSEIPAYILPLPLLAVMGRRPVSALLFLISGIALLSILLIPQSSTTSIMIVALIGRLAVAAVFSVIILHTSELFPTVSRLSVYKYDNDRTDL